MADQLPSWEDTEEAKGNLPSWEDTEEAAPVASEKPMPAYYGAPTDGSIKYQKQDRGMAETIEGAIQGVSESALAGMVPKLVGVTQATLPTSVEVPGDWGQRYETYKTAAEQTLKEAEQKAPIASGVGKVAGVLPYAAAAGPSVGKDIVMQGTLSGISALNAGKGLAEAGEEAGYAGLLSGVVGRYGKPIGEAAKWVSKSILTAPARFHGMSTEAIDTLVNRPMDVILSKDKKIQLGPELEAPVAELRKKIAAKQLSRDELASEIRNLQQNARMVRENMKDAAALEREALKSRQAEEMQALTSQMGKPVAEAQSEVGKVKAALEESKLVRGEANLAASEARKQARDNLKAVGVSEEAVDKLDEALLAQKKKVSDLAQRQYDIMRSQGVDVRVDVPDIKSALASARKDLTIEARPKMVKSKLVDETGAPIFTEAAQSRVGMERGGIIDEFFSKYGEVADSLTLPDAVKYRQAIDDLIDWNSATGAYGGKAEGALKQARNQLNDLIDAKIPDEFSGVRAELADASRLQSEASKLFGRGDKYKALERGAEAKNKRLQEVLAGLEESTGVGVTPHLKEFSEARATLQSPLKLDKTVPEVRQALEAMKKQQGLQSQYTSQQEKLRGLERAAKEAESAKSLASTKELEAQKGAAAKSMEASRRQTAKELVSLREEKIAVGKEISALKEQVAGGLSESDINSILTQPRNKLGYREQLKYDALKKDQPELVKRIENLKAREALVEGAEGGTFGRLLKPVALPATVVGAMAQKGLEETVFGPMTPAKKSALQELLREVRGVREKKKEEK